MPELDQFQKDYLSLIDKLTDRVMQLIFAGQSKEEILQIISQRDFKQIILNDPKFKSSFTNLNIMYLRALKDMDKFADISPETLQALTKINQATFFEDLSEKIAVSLKKNITSGVLGGLTKEEIIAGIASDLRPDQIETLVTTALNTYTASINAIMADQLPAQTAFVYRGPVDEKTRPICLELMAAGEMTQEEIQKRFPGAFISRGGYNCRHQWAISKARNVMHSPQQAIKEASERGIAVV